MCQRRYQESDQVHHRLHPREQVRSWPDQQSDWKIRSASTRRHAESDTTLSKHQALLPQDGIRLRGTVFFMTTEIKVKWAIVFHVYHDISLTDNDDSLMSEWREEHHAQLTHISARIWHIRTRYVFLVWLKILTTQDHLKRCFHHKNISSSSPSISHALSLALFPLALQSDLLHDHESNLQCSYLHTKIISASIHRNRLSVLCRNHLSRLQIMSASNLIEDKPMIFHKSSMSSTDDASDRITTLLPESTLDDDQIRKILISSLYSQKREVSADRPRVYHSFETTQCPVHPFPRKWRETCREVLKQKKVESRHIFRQKTFVQDIKRIREKGDLSSDSLIRK